MSTFRLGPAPSGVAFFVTFSLALSTRPNATQIRLAACVLMGALAYKGAIDFHHQGGSHELVYGYMSALATMTLHAVDYLVVVRASSSDPGVIGNDKSAAGSPPSVFAQYLRMPVSLLFNWRRIGTKWQISNIPPFSRRDPSYTPSRLALILQRIVRLGLCLVAIDLCSVTSLQDSELMKRSRLVVPFNQVEKEDIIFRLNLVGRYTISAITGVYVGYAAITILSLVLFLSSAKDCPPMFGRLSDAYTVRRYRG